MRVWVTGAAGFIGWRVSELLLDQGHRVIGIDSLHPSYDGGLKTWRLSALQRREGFAFHRCDIADRSRLRTLAQRDVPDAMINLAARAGVRDSLHEPRAFVETNVVGALALLELCRDVGVRKFVQASTSSVYGPDDPLPWSEEARGNRPLSPYAASKLAAEVLAHTYHHLWGLDVTILRYFTVYGPAGRPDMAVFRFLRAIAEGDDVDVYGDGRQRRDFTYVDDIARGTVAALQPVKFEVVNLGSGRPVPLEEVISRLERLLGRPARKVHRPAHPADAAETWANVEKAARLLAWRPEWTLDAGLQATVEWYRDQREWAKGVLAS